MKKYIFESKTYRGLKVVLKPAKRVRVGDEFENRPGLSIRFLDGYFVTTDKKLAEVIRAEIVGNNKYGVVVEVKETKSEEQKEDKK